MTLLFRFYICCDKCQDWFHGTCVGILQSEADFIDEYICPNCQKNSSINSANMKSLGEIEFEGLLSFLKTVQVGIFPFSYSIFTSFIDPVDASEVPDYYHVIKEPMGKILI
jgi:nucleosome-remodeling factor subunit BPTF